MVFAVFSQIVSNNANTTAGASLCVGGVGGPECDEIAGVEPLFFVFITLLLIAIATSVVTLLRKRKDGTRRKKLPVTMFVAALVLATTVLALPPARNLLFYTVTDEAIRRCRDPLARQPCEA